MKQLFLIFFVISYNIYTGQNLNNMGAVKFYFTDSLNVNLIVKECYITYNKNSKLVLQTDTSDFKHSLIYEKAGIYTFRIRTKGFKDVLISGVEIIEEKTTFITIRLYPKASVKDRSIIKQRYQKPMFSIGCG